jgi:hypothetical protein
MRADIRGMRNPTSSSVRDRRLGRLGPAVITITVRISPVQRMKISGTNHSAIATPGQIAARLREEVRDAVGELTDPFVETPVKARVTATGRIE